MNKNKDEIARTTQVNFNVHLNEDKIPVGMDWDATDSPIPGNKTCKALMISIWDAASKNTMRFDLWTKYMPVNEMNALFFQTLASMAQTYQRATGNAELSKELHKFAKEFGIKAGVLKK